MQTSNMSNAPPPKSRELLPPLLACLPTSFVSPNPPPALLPLLSPLLRQRVTYLGGNTGSDGWLRLLSWDAHRGSRLPEVVERMDLEPHPVSGELEIEEPAPARYRRLDQETLQARLEVEQFDLLPIYVWCEKDEHGGTDPGWKLAELRRLDDIEDGTEWFDTPSEASEAVGAPAAASTGRTLQTPAAENGDDEDDYWAAYDRTPARTPAKRSPAPVPSSVLQMTSRPDRGEDDYYARYAEEVQPALDNHDPDEDTGDFGDSTLNGDSLIRSRAPEVTSSSGITQQADYVQSLQPHSDWKHPHDSAVHTALNLSVNGEQLASERDLSMPRPISPALSTSSVDKLEEQAAAMSSPVDENRASHAVKQHISTDIKSLFRLAKASGMDREEFTRIVKTELDVLSMMEQDE